jgi:hypothetical protein
VGSMPPRGALPPRGAFHPFFAAMAKKKKKSTASADNAGGAGERPSVERKSELDLSVWEERHRMIAMATCDCCDVCWRAGLQRLRQSVRFLGGKEIVRCRSPTTPWPRPIRCS